jgi:hypothetical protein
MAQVVEHLLCKSLSSNPSLTKKKRGIEITQLELIFFFAQNLGFAFFFNNLLFWG